MRLLPVGCTRLLTVLTFTLALSACRGCAGKDDLAFCEAVERNDAAAAQALLATGRINLFARNFTGSCQPVAAVFGKATAQSPEFTAMAVSLAKQEGVANTSFAKSSERGRPSPASAESPLRVAARHENPVLVRALVAAGANLRNQTARNTMVDVGGSGSVEIARLLVEGGADPGPALGLAILNRHTALVSYLESKGAREDADPVLVAARQGDLAAIDAAIARRANLEVEDTNGRTPLMRAAFYGQVAAVTRLGKAGASAGHVDEDGLTALHLAAKKNEAPMIQALVAAGAGINARAGAESPTPLLTAIAHDAAAAVSALVDLGADTNVAIESDLSAISKSIALGNLAMTRALLRGGARINERRGARWQPPIHWSLGICGLPPEGGKENDYYRITLLQTIVAAGGSATATNAQGQTPLEAVTKNLAETRDAFPRACLQAKLEYLKSLR
jgi:ankyrin repeat protein